MARVNRQDIEKIAALAHLDISEREKEALTAELDEILTYAERIQGLDTDRVQATSHALQRADAFREDEEAPCLPRDDALRNAPDKGDGLIKVPEVIP